MNKTMTDWFDIAFTKPVNAGVFEHKDELSKAYSYWNGEAWCGSWATVGQAAAHSCTGQYGIFDGLMPHCRGATWRSTHWRGFVEQQG